MGRGVYELRERFEGNAYRLVYVLSLQRAIYVLHAFVKKSKIGTSLPKPDITTLDERLKRAHRLDMEH